MEVSRRFFWSLDSTGFLDWVLCLLRENDFNRVLSYILFNE